MKRLFLISFLLSLFSCLDDSGTNVVPSVLYLDRIRVNQDTLDDELYRVSAQVKNVPEKSRWRLDFYLDGQKIDEKMIDDSIKGEWLYFFEFPIDQPGEYDISVCLVGKSSDFCRETELVIE